ncbi:hypothetical protein LTR62_002674 [Meristemomyces frigidus]|uniref:Cell division control protein 14 n=1 Tax=Meristemomyces frigidus TaxID=1508187 RepID=A0AAN7TLS0_9PEZI|nr:hypothetical protein LTR62_002674 [Meristemomyces frigidus]
MESLLSLSFSNLSSRDTTRIRKGIRQIEGLLAQICLSGSRLSPQKQQRSRESEGGAGRGCKELRELRKDAAFREFFRLQEGFRWNVATHLLSTLERLLGLSPTSSTNANTINSTIHSTLTLLQGTLLLHPPSRYLFAREDYMNLLLDLLDPTNNPPTNQSQVLLVLVTALLGEPGNTRCFETCDGLDTVTSLFKGRNTAKEVKMGALEFLYFYLMPEAPPTTSSSAPNTSVLQRSPSKIDAMAAHARTHSGDSDRMDVDEEEMAEGSAGKRTKTTEEKQKLLGRHLSNVAELVRDLRENAIFAAAAGVT